MGTNFDVRLVSEDADYARQLAGAAFEELARLESELSRFVPSSDVSRINRLRGGETVQIGVCAYECLQIAARIWEETNGAFDPTVSGLLAVGQDKRLGDRERLLERERWGMRLVEVHREENAVTAAADGLVLDLGGIGKGYALDKMAELLGEWEAGSGLLQGGESTALPMGRPPAGGWQIGLRAPRGFSEQPGQLRLRERAVSGSGVTLHGRHIIDPCTGEPASGRVATWALAGTAARADALSTAFIVMDNEGIRSYCADHPDTGAMVMPESGAGGLLRFGRWP